MNARILRRYVFLLAIATFAMVTVSAMVRQFTQVPPGDFQVRRGDQRLSELKFEEALEAFDLALEQAPHHRGAMMGRAIVFLETERFAEAEAAFAELITYLTETLEADDPTGTAVLAAAYANRGILYDRTSQHEQALADYRQAMKIDEGAIKGPNIFHRILYGNSRPATIAKRAEYLASQMALPEEQRLLRDPVRDAEQRMHKP